MPIVMDMLPVAAEEYLIREDWLNTMRVSSLIHFRSFKPSENHTTIYSRTHFLSFEMQTRYATVSFASTISPDR